MMHFRLLGDGLLRASTVGLDEARVRQYIRDQDELDRRQGELDLE